MSSRLLLAAVLSSIMLGAGSARAEEHVCGTECTEGTVEVSFADGNSVNCICAPQGEGMQDVIAEPGGEPQPGDA